MTNANEADDIILLGSGGEIASQGRFSELQSVEEFKLLQSELRNKGGRGDSTDNAQASESGKDKKELRQDAKDVEKEDKQIDSTADSKLYAYYFSSVGWNYVVGALMLGFIDMAANASSGKSATGTLVSSEPH